MQGFVISIVISIVIRIVIIFVNHHYQNCSGMPRPWDQREGGGGVQGQGGEGGRGTKASPLDALFNMISNNDALTAKSGKQGRKE